MTRPIKGTRPRGKNGVDDAALKEQLLSSPKDRAELLMITDLERNDLGRVCRTGSVRVRDLKTVETYPQVHHLVSTIEGELEDGRDLVDLLKATFPSGSVTGAPKVRAMQIIRELEPHAREVYCGAIGYVSLNGKAQFNVAIRTMVVKEGTAHFWSGGGIVADSDPENEYEETLIKARGLIGALNVGAGSPRPY
jgi:para-aminobenzoate synthetase component 1